jgi:hypothetical protein
VQRITGELADLAEAAARDAHRVLVNARRAQRRAQAKAAKLAQAGLHDPAEGRRGVRALFLSCRIFKSVALADSMTSGFAIRLSPPRFGKCMPHFQKSQASAKKPLVAVSRDSKVVARR